MLTTDLLSEIGGTKGACALFTRGVPDPDKVDEIRVMLEEMFFEYGIEFKPRDNLGYYYCKDVNSRCVEGLWPVDMPEVCLLMLYVSTLVFNSPEVDASMRWINDVADRCRHLDRQAWSSGIDSLSKLIQKKMVAENGP